MASTLVAWIHNLSDIPFCFYHLAPKNSTFNVSSKRSLSYQYMKSLMLIKMFQNFDQYWTPFVRLHTCSKGWGWCGSTPTDNQLFGGHGPTGDWKTGKIWHSLSGSHLARIQCLDEHFGKERSGRFAQQSFQTSANDENTECKKLSTLFSVDWSAVDIIP